MSDLTIVHRVLMDVEREHMRRSVTSFHIGAQTEMHLPDDEVFTFLPSTFGGGERQRLFNIPIVIDKTLPPNEIQLKSGDRVLRMVNLEQERSVRAALDLPDAIECAPGTRTVEIAQIEEPQDVLPMDEEIRYGPTIRVAVIELKPYRKGTRIIFYGEHQGKKFVAYS